VMSESKRILVIQDNPGCGSGLETTLESLGFQIQAVPNGFQAVEHLDPMVDVVLLDVPLSGGDGFDLLRRIRHRAEVSHIPIIVAVARDAKDELLRAISLGANDFVSKPFEKGELRIRLASALRLKEAQQPLRESDTQCGTLVQAAVREVRDSLEQCMNEETSELLQAEARLRDEFRRLEEALHALRESEEQYRNFFVTSRDCVFITTVDGKFIDVNDAGLEILGYDPGERDLAMQRDVASFYANPAERQAHTELVAKAGFTKEYPIDLRKKDGTIIHALITTVSRRDRHGTVTGFQGTIRDITERTRAEEVLRNTVQRFYTILSSLYAGVLIVTEEGTVEFANQAFCDMFDLDDSPFSLRGLRAPEMMGKILRAYANPFEAVARIKEVVARQQAVKGEEIAIRGGRTYVVDFIPIFVDGVRCGRLWHHIDITGRKNAENEREILRNQLAQSQKLEAIGTLAGGIAHDFNNMLTVINGYTEMILSERAEDHPLCSDLEKILATGRKGADLVQRLLALSKRSDISLQPLDVNRPVDNAVAVMERTFPKLITIRKVLGEDLHLVNADALQVEQALMNLCINAKEAMPSGGRLTIETRNALVDDPYCRLCGGTAPGRYVLIEVSDTGGGMSKETMDRIFDPFFTTKGWDSTKGTGLGLSVAKGIVEQHDGWIACQSERGHGTTFTIYFPVLEDLRVSPNDEPSAQPVSAGEKILVIDDEEYILDLGRLILERSGYTVITASEGTEALKIYASQYRDIGLVILDLVMPHMDGIKCLEELVEINPAVKVVISTGRSLALDERDRFSSYARGFINKPYNVQQLVRTVQAVLAAGTTPQ
jgi:two-component system, cell cycle sensor histidine kinase and response regulator CckA